MKKILFIFTVCILISCTGKNETPVDQNTEYRSPEILLTVSEPVHLTVWHHYNAYQKEKFDELVDLFNNTVGQKYGVSVKSVRRAGNAAELASFLKEALAQKIGADEAPDIFAAYPDTAFEFDKAGLLARLNDYLTQTEKNEYVSGFLYSSGFGIPADIKLFPIAKATENLIVNKTAWEPFAKEHKLSYEDLKTWEDIARVAELYYETTDAKTAAPNDGMPFFGRDSASNYMLVGSFELGTDMFTAAANGSTKYSLNKKVLKKLWDNYYVPFVKGYFGAEGRFRSDDLKTGTIIACVSSTSSAVYLPQAVADKNGKLSAIELEILPLPHFKNAQRKAAVQQGTDMAVLKSFEHKELGAMLFLKWFTAAEQNIDFAVGSGYLPVKKEALLPANIRPAYPSPDNEVLKYIAPSMEASIQSIMSSSLYFQPGFYRADEARAVLYDAIHTKAKTARKTLQAAASNPALYRETLRRLTDSGSFERWYDELEKSLNALQ